jgi:hypothetical protein
MFHFIFDLCFFGFPCRFISMTSKNQKLSWKRARTGFSLASWSTTPDIDAEQTSQAPSSPTASEVLPLDRKTQFERCFSVASKTDEDVLSKRINSPFIWFIDSHF